MAQPDRNPETPTVVAVLLACAAVVAAIIGARAAIVGDDGSDTWHGSVREDVKKGAGLVEDVRFVYTEEAALAFQVAEGEVRAEEALREAKAATGLAAEVLAIQSGAQQGVVDTVKSSSALAKNEKYHLPEGGYDVPQRLLDTRSKNPDLVELDPDATEQEGADLSFESALLVASTLPAGLAFLCGALAHGFPSRRRWLVPLGFGLTGVSLILALIVEVTH